MSLINYAIFMAAVMSPGEEISNALTNEGLGANRYLFNWTSKTAHLRKRIVFLILFPKSNSIILINQFLSKFLSGVHPFNGETIIRNYVQQRTWRS